MMRRMRPRHPTALCLYSGAGGLARGLEDEGFAIVGGVEAFAPSVESFALNIRDMNGPLVKGLVEDQDGAALLASAGLAAGDLDVLAVGLPADASKAGYATRRRGDGGVTSLDDVLRLVAETSPRALIIDSVPSLLYRRTAETRPIDVLNQRLRTLGYQTTWRVLNPADFGVAQNRQRLALVASVLGLPAPVLPMQTHAETKTSALPGLQLPSWTTALQAFSRLEDTAEPGEVVGGRWGHLLPQVPPGGNYQDLSNSGTPLFAWRSRYWSFLSKLDPHQPSPTIAARPGPYTGPFHWANRRLRVPEVKRLLGLPDDFVVVGNRSQQQFQLGNAVPGPLARGLARSASEILC